MKQEPTTLATGAEFNESTWNDFSERLKFHCRGKGVSDHYTRDAIFVVREKIHTYGYDEDYAHDTVLIVFDEEYETVEAFMEVCDEQCRVDILVAANDLYGVNSEFSTLSEFQKRDCVINSFDDARLVGRQTGYRTVNFHLTREAAEAFIDRKKHDYAPGALGIWVECQMYCWEFNAIKDAIMDGRLVYKTTEVVDTQTKT